MIEIKEEPHNDGTIKLSWKATTTDDFRKIVDLIKTTIPTIGRRYDPEAHVWFVGIEYANRIKDIRDIMEAELRDRPVDAEQKLQSRTEALRVFNGIYKLHNPYYERAVFAAEAVTGKTTSPFSYSVARQAFGAWSEGDQLWYYTDGRYSSCSPLDLDEQAREDAIEGLQRILNSGITSPGKCFTDEYNAKVAFRARVLDNYEHRCFVCLETPESESKLHMHRVIPGRNGGMYVEDNVVLLCSSCHKRHEGKSWEVFHKLHNAAVAKGVR